MSDDVDRKRIVTVAGVLTGLGIVGGSMSGVSFLAQPIQVPLWFVLAVTIVPTGEILQTVRTFIKKYRPG